MTQADAVTLARGKVDGLSDVSPDGLSGPDILCTADRRSRSARAGHDCLKDEALHGEGPWLVQNVTADDIGGFYKVEAGQPAIACITIPAVSNSPASVDLNSVNAPAGSLASTRFVCQTRCNAMPASPVIRPRHLSSATRLRRSA